MKVHELIANLHDVDPDGESEVMIYIHRRYGGTQAAVDDIRRFTADGPVMITDKQGELE
jgi:hypothetical protein